MPQRISMSLRKLNIRHDWHLESTEDGGVYKRCRRCGKDDDPVAEGRVPQGPGRAPPDGDGFYGVLELGE